MLAYLLFFVKNYGPVGSCYIPPNVTPKTKPDDVTPPALTVIANDFQCRCRYCTGGADANPVNQGVGKIRGGD
jgi:hypothetical protein